MPTKSLTFRLDESLIPVLEARAAQDNYKRSTYVQQLVEQHLSTTNSQVEPVADEETKMLLRSIQQDTVLLKEIVAQKAREQSRDLARLTSQQKGSRTDLATALAAILEVVCDVSRDEAIKWTKEHMNR